jgi:hypothetical protein
VSYHASERICYFNQSHKKEKSDNIIASNDDDQQRAYESEHEAVKEALLEAEQRMVHDEGSSPVCNHLYKRQSS